MISYIVHRIYDKKQITIHRNGFDTAAIVDMSEVVEYLYNKECQGSVLINDEMKKAIDDYYALYGVK